MIIIDNWRRRHVWKSGQNTGAWFNWLEAWCPAWLGVH